jgi:hypothetical protein
MRSRIKWLRYKKLTFDDHQRKLSYDYEYVYQSDKERIEISKIQVKYNRLF